MKSGHSDIRCHTTDRNGTDRIVNRSAVLNGAPTDSVATAIDDNPFCPRNSDGARRRDPFPAGILAMVRPAGVPRHHERRPPSKNPSLQRLFRHGRAFRRVYRVRIRAQGRPWTLRFNGSGVHICLTDRLGSRYRPLVTFPAIETNEEPGPSTKAPRLTKRPRAALYLQGV